MKNSKELTKFSEKLAEKVFDLISKNPRNWKKLWGSKGSSPCNIKTGSVYRGTNRISLMFDCMLLGIRPLFTTYGGILEILGVTGLKAKYWRTFWALRPKMYKLVDKETKEPILDVFGKEQFRIGGYSWVKLVAVDDVLAKTQKFNSDKYDEVSETLENYLTKKGYINQKGKDNDLDVYNTHMPKFNTILDSLGCTYAAGGDDAYFSPSSKHVQMPTFKSFHIEAAWVGTFAHELGHATMLNKAIKDNEKRGQSCSFGSATYAFEELIAEFFAVLYCADHNIEQTQNNNAAYLKGWMSKLGDLYANHKDAFFLAAKIATKNYEHITTVLDTETAAKAA